MIASVESARRRARALYPRSIGFQEAFLDGWRARRAGRPVDACPYATGGRRRRARPGWRATWRAVWVRGWLAGG